MAESHAFIHVLPEQHRIPSIPEARSAAGEEKAESRSHVESVQEVEDSGANDARFTWTLARMTEKLHDDIFNALPADFVRRMWNWVRSRDGGSVATSRFDERVDNTREEHPIPVMLGEADDTHRAVLTLPQRYQEVITIFWTRNRMTLAEMACSTPRTRLWKIGKASFRVWLDIGHHRLQMEIEEQTKEHRTRHTLTV